jgi:hypothetical protein
VSAEAPEVTEPAPEAADAAPEAETPVDVEDAGATKRQGRRLELPQVSLPLHAAERAVERVAFAHERRDLKRAANAEKHAAKKDAEHTADARKLHAIDYRAAAAAMRESARERRGAAHERQTVAKEKRSVADEHRAAAETHRADAAEKREAAKERKSSGKRPEK